MIVSFKSYAINRFKIREGVTFCLILQLVFINAVQELVQERMLVSVAKTETHFAEEFL